MSYVVSVEWNDGMTQFVFKTQVNYLVVLIKGIPSPQA